ncbi:perlucin-like protein [Diadema antillarum]|uniref:perlucin-like protein n=1 Tax=Diadema antillarum TaxID=105358 RepID=UPI003A8B0140
MNSTLEKRSTSSTVPNFNPRNPQSNTIYKMKVFKQLLFGLVTCIHAFHRDVVCPGDASSPDSCYLYRQDQQTWEVARDTCDELGGYLVAMGTQSEQSSIRNDVLASHYGITTFSGIWVGLNDRLSEQFYTWEHVGGTLPHSSGVWGGGPPLRSTGVNQDCIYLYANGLSDDYCYRVKPFICEFKP